MIKNRLHVLAQYLRVKLPMDDQDVESILKLIIDSFKFSKKASTRSLSKTQRQFSNDSSRESRRDFGVHSQTMRMVSNRGSMERRQDLPYGSTSCLQVLTPRSQAPNDPRRSQERRPGTIHTQNSYMHDSNLN